MLRTRWTSCGGALVLVVFLAFGLGLNLQFDFKKKVPYKYLDSRSHKDGNGHGRDPVVNLVYASYRGTYLDNGVSEFLGMRYARPPTRDLRWRAPVKPAVEESIQSAKKIGPYCLGISENPSDKIDEDCLFVNVWAPTNATADMNLPVMVFFQGGGYTGNSNAYWNGSRLVDTSGGNIVFVSFNYRVGLWGFLAGEEVRRNGDLNVGLLDQRLLLEWVQEHISMFGGDPNHVIIHGISAGAGSIALHLMAYGGRDDRLFVGAILESTFIPAHFSVSELEYQFEQTVGNAGCQNVSDRMDCLRGTSMNELQKYHVPKPFPGRRHDPLFPWTPCIDGHLLENRPSVMIKQNRLLKVPLLIGTCSNEGSVFAANASTSDDFISFYQDNHPKLKHAQGEDIVDHYPLELPLPKHNSWFPSASHAYGESTFICPTHNILHAFNHSSSLATWSYRYNFQDNDLNAQGLGVIHANEAPAVFGPDMVDNAAPASFWTYNAVAVPLLMNYWLSFVRALDPNVYKEKDAPKWEAWGKHQSRIILQHTGSMMEKIAQGEQARCKFWQRMSATMDQ